MFGRQIPDSGLKKAVAVVIAFITICAVSTVLLLATSSNTSVIDVVYETVSATATVGLSRNLTASLNSIGKLIIIATMYLGRVGPISLAIAFNKKTENVNLVKNPVEEVSVG